MLSTVRRFTIVVLVLVGLLSCQSTSPSTTGAESDPVPEYEREYRDRIDAARASARARRYRDAEQALTDVIAAIAEDTRPLDAKTSVMAHMYRGVVLIDLERATEARRDLERALELYAETDDPYFMIERDLWEHLGRACGIEGDPVAALEAFETAIQVNRNAEVSDPVFASRMHMFRSYAYGQMGDESSALEAFEAAIAAQEDLEQTQEHLQTLGAMHLELAQRRFRLEDYAGCADAALRAAELMESANADPARIGDAHYFRAVGLMQAGIEEGQPEAYREAIRSFDQTTNPNFEYLAVASFNLGNYHQRRGELQIAEGCFERAAEAYGHVLRVIRNQETQRPGSIPPEARRSLEFRLADAEQRLAQVRSGTSAAAEESPVAGLNVRALRGDADTPLSRFIRDVLNPTMDGVDQTVTMANDDLTLVFKPDLLYTLTDRATGRIERGRRGFDMDLAVQAGRVYLLPVDPSTMSRDEFLEESDYKDRAPVVLRGVDSDGSFVTFEYVRPEERAGERLVLEIVPSR
ncbi:MAG: tetratricopeptide repeat protein [Spirochaetota bacterium]